MWRFLAVPMLLLMLLPALLPAQGGYSRRRGPSSATATSGPYNGPAVTFNGTLKTISKKELLLELDAPDPAADRQSLTFRFSRKTKFMKGDQEIKPTDLEVGTHLSLDATREGDQKLTAVSVIVAAAKPAAKEK